MTHTRHTDVAILGAGTAGLGARRAALAAGKTPLLIDPGPFGTTCARVGCMPSKLLIAAANTAHHAQHTEVFGIDTGQVTVHSSGVLSRVQSERDRFVGLVSDVIDEARQDRTLLEGRAQVIGPGRLQVEETQITYNSLVVATGGRSFIPQPFREVHDFILTNENIFDLQKLPKRLLVVGTGVIGLELGQAFDRLGVKTTLVGIGGAIGPISDPEVLKVAKKVLGSELDLHPEYELINLEPRNSEVSIEFVDSHGRRRQEAFDKILVAAGRKPNLDNIGLESLGIGKNDDGNWPINPDTLQLGDLPVFIAGDANDLHPVLHEASNDGRLAGKNAAQFPDIRARGRRTNLSIVFCQPQIAIVGRGYRELEECEGSVGVVDYEKQGRARVLNANRGIARIYGDRHTGELIGAEMLAPGAEHLGHLLAWAVQQRMTVEQALSMPYYHPVLEEGLRTAIRDLSANMRHRGPVKCRVSENGVGG